MMNTKIRTVLAMVLTWPLKIVLLVTETVPFGFLFYRWVQLLIESLEENIDLHQWVIVPYLVMPVIGALNLLLSLLGLAFSLLYPEERALKRNRNLFIISMIVAVAQTILTMVMFAIF